MKKVVKVLMMILVGVAIGLTINLQTEKTEEKTIVATQIAYDGEMQITYSDGTYEMIWVQVPEKKEEVKIEYTYYQDGNV